MNDRRKALGDSIRRGVVWAMIPLALLAGRPSTGCLCADGRHKELCSHDAAPRSGGAHDTREQHACCCRSGMAACASSRHREHDCCRRGKADGGLSQAPGCRCTPLFNSVGVVARAADNGAQVGQPLVVWQAPPEVPSVRALSAGCLPPERTTGPPVDRVIVLRCLLI